MPGTTPQIGDILQIRVNCHAGQQLSQNVLHYKVRSTGGGGLTLLGIATSFRDRVSVTYRVWMPIAATFQGCTVQNMTPPKTDPVVGFSAAAGTSAGDLLPKQVSGLIRLTTGLGGRPNRGRVYPGLMSSSYADASGELNGGGLASLQNLADAIGPAFVLNILTVTTELVLLVRHPDVDVPVAHTPVGTEVIACGAQSGIATQRRRGDYGRPNP